MNALSTKICHILVSLFSLALLNIACSGGGGGGGGDGDGGGAADGSSGQIVSQQQPDQQQNPGPGKTTIIGGDTDSDDNTNSDDGSDGGDDGAGANDDSDDLTPAPVEPAYVKLSDGNSNEVEEVASAGVTFSLNRTADETCYVTYQVTGGSAVKGADSACAAGDDYLLGGMVDGLGTLEIIPGENEAAFALSLCEDGVYEGDESIEITFTQPATGCLLNSTAGEASYVFNYTIHDDELQPTLAFASASGSGDESVGSVDLTVNLSHASSSTVTANYSFTGSATNGGSDFNSSNGSLAFSPGEVSKTITIQNINDDSRDEYGEDIIVTLADVTAAGLGTSVFTYTIEDNDAAPAVQFASSSSTGSEGDLAPQLSVTIDLSAPSDRTIRVDVDDDSTTEAGIGDYAFTDLTVTFAPGETTKTIAVDVTDDADASGDLNEGSTEQVVLNLSNPDDNGVGDLDAITIGARSSHVVTITDDDAQYTVGFSAATSAGSEGVASVDVTIQVTGGAFDNPAFNITCTDATTAAGATDYTLDANCGTIAYPANTASITVTLFAVSDDTLYEGDEDVVIQMTDADGGVGIDTATFTYTIQDNDSAPNVSFAAATSSGTEAAGSVTANAELDAPTGVPIIFDYTITGGSVEADAGLDFTDLDAGTSGLSGTLTFPGDASTVVMPLRFVVREDQLNGGDTGELEAEDVILTLSTSGGGTLATHTYTINDNDVAPAGDSPHVAALVNSGSSVTLMWDAGVGAVDYAIQYGVGTVPTANCPAPQGGYSAVDADSRIHTFSGLSSGLHTFRICSINAGIPALSSAGTMVTVDVNTASYPPACDDTAVAGTTFADFQTNVINTIADANADGFYTACIAKDMVVASTNADRLTTPSDYFILRGVSAYAHVDNNRTVTGATDAAANSAIYVNGHKNVMLMNLRISTDGEHGAGIQVADQSTIWKIDDVFIDTTGVSGYGILLAGNASIAEINEVTVTTKGDNAHGLVLDGTASVQGIDTTKFRRAPNAVDATAVGVFFDSDGSPFYNSQTVSWNGLYVCDINAGINWAFYRQDGSDPDSAITWGGSEPAYAAYSGANSGAQTFPGNGQAAGIGGVCPPSWTQIYSFLTSPTTRCLDSCHAAGQTNKWNLTTSSTAYTDGIAKGHLGTTFQDTDETTRANCGNSTALARTSGLVFDSVTFAFVGETGWTGFDCEDNATRMMPKNGGTAGRPYLNETEIEAIAGWMNAGGKND